MKNITIVGGGSSGYLTAMYLANRYPATQFTWIFPEANKPIGVGEALVPDVSHFMAEFGVTVEDILRHAEGTLKIGIKFANFNPGEEFNFPYGENDFDIFDEIIKQHKIPHNIMKDKDISVHFNANKVLEYFDTILHKFTNLKIIREDVDKEKLTNTYDLLIDCTGFKRVVADWPDNFVSIQDRIPNDQAFVYRANYTNRKKQMTPYTIAHAMDSGWIWNIPLRNQLSMGYVHDSKFNVKNEFVDYIENKIEQKINPDDIVTIKMKTGRNKVHMRDSIVAIGLSSSFIEPLESTGLYITTSSVKQLCEYIDGNITEDDYNKWINDNYDSLVNFIVAHYKYSDRNNEYWNHYKHIPVEKYRPINIFPLEAWDFILNGLKQNHTQSLKNIDFKQMINIRKGQEFHIWMENFC